MHFRLVGGARDAFPVGRRGQKCIPLRVVEDEGALFEDLLPSGTNF